MPFAWRFCSCEMARKDYGSSVRQSNYYTIAVRLDVRPRLTHLAKKRSICRSPIPLDRVVPRAGVDQSRSR